jgi:hypothetical protein
MSNDKEYKIEWANEELSKIYDIAVPAGKHLIDSVRGIEPINAGGEKIVYDYGEDKVVAFLPTSERQDYIHRLKHFYYFAKLMHIFLPGNVPDAHMVHSQPPMMIFDKVQAHTLASVEERMELIDYFAEIGVHIDSHEDNFLKDKDGVIHFVDIFQIEDREKLEAAVDSAPDEVRATAQRYFNRLDPDIKGPYISGNFFGPIKIVD